MIGALLGGRYELLQLIGTGGMSHVYKGRCRLLNRFVAVKILRDEFKSDKEFIKKFYIESQAAASLSNPNIVSVYDVGEENGIYYIVMEYVSGVTLKEVINQNKILEWNVALTFSIQISIALECAHRNGIVHRDIKPHNIMVTDEGKIKVTDFGIARAINSNETKRIDEAVIGSVHYISPEQAKGIMIDARSDIYSLGVVMYEMLTGRLPYDGDNAVSVALMHLNSEPIPIKDINIAVPNEIIEIVKKAMQRDVAQRYQNIREMATGLYEFKKRESLNEPAREDEYITKTIGLVKKARAINEAERKDNEAHSAQVKFSDIDNSDDDALEKGTGILFGRKKEKPDGDIKVRGNKKGRNKESKEKTTDKKAAWAAYSVSGVVIIAMLFVFMKIFMPNVNVFAWVGEIFKPKEYFLEDYTDKKYDDIKTILEKEGFKVTMEEMDDDKKEAGTILDQRPSGNMTVKVKSTTVVFTVSRSEVREKVELPRLIDKEYIQAEQILTSLELSYKESFASATATPEGYVMDQNPPPGTSVSKGTEVVLIISRKAPEDRYEVPNFIGKTEEEAKKLALEAGIKYSFAEKITTDTAKVGKVIEQNIAAGSTIANSTNVTITIGKQDTSPTPSPTTSSASPKTVNFSVDLPRTEGSSDVVVKKDGTIVYKEKHNNALGRVSVPITGVGICKIEITVNGLQSYSENYKFE